MKKQLGFAMIMIALLPGLSMADYANWISIQPTSFELPHNGGLVEFTTFNLSYHSDAEGQVVVELYTSDFSHAVAGGVVELCDGPCDGPYAGPYYEPISMPGGSGTITYKWVCGVIGPPPASYENVYWNHRGTIDIENISVTYEPEPFTLYVSPFSHDFGSVQVGFSSGSFDFTVENISNTAGSASISSNRPQDFGITSGGGSVSFSPRQSRTVRVVFHPEDSGGRNGVLVVTGGGSPTATMTGVGTSPFTIYPSGVCFNGCVTMLYEDYSPPENLTVTNASGQTRVATISIDPPECYVITAGGGPHSFSPYQSRNVTVVFHPIWPQAASASLVVTGNGVVTAVLEGNPVCAGIDCCEVCPDTVIYLPRTAQWVTVGSNFNTFNYWIRGCYPVEAVACYGGDPYGGDPTRLFTCYSRCDGTYADPNPLTLHVPTTSDDGVEMYWTYLLQAPGHDCSSIGLYAIGAAGFTLVRYSEDISVSMSPTTVDFGVIAIGDVSTAHDLIVTNNGPHAGYIVFQTSAPSEFDVSWEIWNWGDPRRPGQQVEVWTEIGESVAVPMLFHPTTDGLHTAGLITLGGGSPTVQLTGHGGLSLISPNGGESWSARQVNIVQWDGSGATGNVRIELNRAYPSGSWEVLGPSTPNDGQQEVAIAPGNLSSACRVRVSALNGSGSDFSDASFSIESCAPGSISGTVVDANGDPVPQALVTRINTATGDALGRRTNPNGTFDFSDLPSGHYVLQITHWQYSGLMDQQGLDIHLGCGDHFGHVYRLAHSVAVPEIDTVVVRQTLDVHQDPLVAGKTTVVIARVRPTYPPAEGVTGMCWVHVNGVVRPLGIRNETESGFQPITIRGSYSDPEKEQWRDALYFRVDDIPESQNVQFEVQLAQGQQNVGLVKWSAVFPFVESSSWLPIVFVPIVHNGASVTGEEARLFKETCRLQLEATLPYGLNRLSCAVSVESLVDMGYTSNAGAEDIMLQLATRAFWDRSGAYFVGILPATDGFQYLGFDGLRGVSNRPGATRGSPWNRSILVCGGDDPTSPLSYAVVEHELGHAVADLPDVHHCSPCDYPECRLDVDGLNAADNLPTAVHRRTLATDVYKKDIMTCQSGFEWLRLNPTYEAFRNAALGSTVSRRSSLDDVGTYCVISGIVARDSSAAPLFEVQNYTGDYTPMLPDSGGYSLTWYDEEVNLLQTLYFDPVFERREGLLDYANFFVVTSRPENGAIVTLNVGDHEVARITQSGYAPTVQLLCPNSGTLGDSAIVIWTAGDLDGDSLRYDVYANRDGGNWEPLSLGLHDTFIVWHTSYFPGTNAGRVKVVVSDGWNTASDSSAGTFVIPMHAPEMYIESPQDTVTILSSGYITLSGRASDLEDGNIGYDSLAWYADADFLGTGSMIQASNLAAGLRTIMLIATDSDGQTGSAQTYVNVLADLDRDNMSDAWEIAHGLDTTVNDGYGDLDRDDLTNLREYQLSTWPDSADTDHDTYADGYEVSQGSDPKNTASIPGTPMISSPTLVSPTGTLAYGQQVLFTWDPSTAADSLQPLRYEVQFDADSTFSNPIALYADTMPSITCPYDLAAGLPYYWKVKASDIYGHWIWSAKTSFTRGYNPIMPERVESLVVRVLDDGLHLYWNPVMRDTSGNPLTGIQYVVYAAPAVNDQYQPIAYTSQTEWTDTEVYSLQWPRWFYRVGALAEGNPPTLISRKNWTRSMAK